MWTELSRMKPRHNVFNVMMWTELKPRIIRSCHKYNEWMNECSSNDEL